MNMDCNLHHNSFQIGKVISKHLFKYFFSAFGWIILSLFLIELIVRIFYGFPGLRNINSPDWGRVAASHSVVVIANEGFGITHYVADGEIATPYQGGENIVVLGDSYTEALQVMDNQKYPSIAEESLRQKGYFVDIRNLGFGGRSIADYVYLAPLIISNYDPAIVVFQVNRGDIAEAFKTEQSNYFILMNDQPLSIVHSAHFYGDPWLAWGRDLLNFSSAIVNGYSRYHTVISSRNARIDTTTVSPADPIDITLAVLQALKTAYEGRKLIIIFIPYSPSIIGDSLILEDETTQKMVEIANTIEGWVLINPANEFISLLQNNEIPRGFNNTSPGSGHLNRAGHQIIGSMLASQIEEMLRTQK
jgi:hypothetical protein